MCVTETRTQTNLALGYATTPIGARFDICEHDWDYDTQLGWPHTMQSLNTPVILERIPMDYRGPKKGRNYQALSNCWSATDTLCVCIFAAPPTRSLTLGEMATLLSAINGWESSSYEVMAFGERRINLTKFNNIREVIKPEADTLPERFCHRAAHRVHGNRQHHIVGRTRGSVDAVVAHTPARDDCQRVAAAVGFGPEVGCQHKHPVAVGNGRRGDRPIRRRVVVGPGTRGRGSRMRASTVSSAPGMSV